MDLREAVAIAKQQIADLLAAEAPGNIRMEEYLWDDHLGVWTLTIGFNLGGAADTAIRGYKIVRVSQTDGSVLSVRDR